MQLVPPTHGLAEALIEQRMRQAPTLENLCSWCRPRLRTVPSTNKHGYRGCPVHAAYAACAWQGRLSWVAFDAAIRPSPLSEPPSAVAGSPKVFFYADYNNKKNEKIHLQLF